MRHVLAPALGVLASLLTSCSLISVSDKCEGKVGVNYSVPFQLVGPAGGVIFLHRPPYHPDTVRLYFLGPNGRVQQPLGDVRTNDLSITVIRRDQPTTYDADYEDRYLLYLNHADQDTITLRYRLYENECKRRDLDGIRVFFNGRDQFNGPRDVQIPTLSFPKR